MDSYKRILKDRENRDYSVTRTQRRQINSRLRDGYDMATSEYPGEDFSVSVYTEDLPTKLTAANEAYLREEMTLDDLNTLFAHIALHTTVHIDTLEPGFRISLLRELPDPTVPNTEIKEPLQ